jgi:hypothetical protein
MIFSSGTIGWFTCDNCHLHERMPQPTVIGPIWCVRCTDENDDSQYRLASMHRTSDSSNWRLEIVLLPMFCLAIAELIVLHRQLFRYDIFSSDHAPSFRSASALHVRAGYRWIPRWPAQCGNVPRLQKAICKSCAAWRVPNRCRHNWPYWTLYLESSCSSQTLPWCDLAGLFSSLLPTTCISHGFRQAWQEDQSIAPIFLVVI